MRAPLTTFLLSFMLLTSGCALIPKSVELFQKKVKAFPEPTAKQEEIQRQTALRAKQAAQATLRESIQEQASTNLVASATDTAVLTDAVSTSLGPPSVPSVAPAPLLSTELLSQMAKLNKRVESFAEANEKVEGKKIEGTGWLQIPYFVYVGIILAVLLVGWHLAKTALLAGSIANPAIAPLLGIAKTGMDAVGADASRGLRQLVAGGTNFLTKAKAEISDPALLGKIEGWFTSAHKEAQDEDVKAQVDKILGK